MHPYRSTAKGFYLSIIAYTLLLFLVACSAQRKAAQSPFADALTIRSNAYASGNFEQAKQQMQALLQKNPGNLEVQMIDAAIYLDQFSQQSRDTLNAKDQALLNSVINKLVVVDKALVGNPAVQNWVEPMLHNTFATVLLLEANKQLKTAPKEASDDKALDLLVTAYGRYVAGEEISRKVLQHIESLLSDSATSGLLRARKSAFDNLLAAKSGQLETLTSIFGVSNPRVNTEKNELINEIYQLLVAPSLTSTNEQASALENLDVLKYLMLSDAEELVARKYSETLCATLQDTDSRSAGTNIDDQWQQIRSLYRESLAHSIIGNRLANKAIVGIGIRSKAWMDAYEQSCTNADR